MPSYVCPAKSCEPDVACCSGCCRGSRIRASSSGWHRCCVVEQRPPEVGVRMLRSLALPDALSQKEGRDRKGSHEDVQGCFWGSRTRKLRRNRYLAERSRLVCRARDLRLFKA